MSLDVKRAVRQMIREALHPLKINNDRPDTVQVPSGWLRTPSSSLGRIPTMRETKSALLYLDIWERGEGELNDHYEKLGFMDGLVVDSEGMAHRIIYSEASWTAFKEEGGAWHGTILWNVTFTDGRVLV